MHGLWGRVMTRDATGRRSLFEEQLDVDRWSKHMWHTSQHNSMPIFLGGRLQSQANEMRKRVGLPELGWNDAFPDDDFEECSVHSDGCKGQETHEETRHHQ